MPLQLAWSTDPGLVRSANEDAVSVLVDANGLDAVLIVADGMGGHAAGQLASSIAVEAVAGRMGKRGAGAEPMLERLASALEEANTAVFEAASSAPEHRGMGSTLVVAGIEGDRVGIINVGDSPAYIFTEGEFRLITEDHSWPAEQVRLGLISSEEAHDHPMKHRLTRAIGVWDRVKAFCGQTEMADGDMLVLCSDGIETAGVSPEEVYQLLTLAGDDLDAGVRSIVDRCRQHGAPDNVTLAVARYTATEGTPGKKAPKRKPAAKVRSRGR
jgi:PPM family protein phosphatase